MLHVLPQNLKSNPVQDVGLPNKGLVSYDDLHVFLFIGSKKQMVESSKASGEKSCENQD